MLFTTALLKRVKFILKPSEEGVKVFHQMQQAELHSARVISLQLRRNIEIVGLVGLENETEIVLKGKKVNSLLDSGSQVISVSESYSMEHLSQYPLQPVDVPGFLKPENDHYIIKGSLFNINLRLLWYLILRITIQL